jgi:hypothetical protein
MHYFEEPFYFEMTKLYFILICQRMANVIFFGHWGEDSWVPCSAVVVVVVVYRNVLGNLLKWYQFANKLQK